MIHVIISEALYDKDYLDNHTEGFDALKQATAATTPEAMSAVCGELDVIRQVARGFASAKAGMIFWGMGVSQHTHGTDNARSLISLACLPAMLANRACTRFVVRICSGRIRCRPYPNVPARL